jgi:uncharacterized repeat protein (TIGR01451 family)
VTQADIDGEVAITNTATSDATTPGGFTPVTASESVIPEAAMPAADMVKTASSTVDAAVGDVITYTYVVTNTGNVSLSDVTVSDVHSGTGTLGAISPVSVASLAVGDSATFTADYTVTQADVDAGDDITNTATMSAVPPTGTPVTADESVSVEAVAPAPDSTLTKTASDDTDVAVGDVITYTYVFTNTGNVSLSDVSITDVHSGTGTLGAVSPGLVSVVAVGDSASFTADYTVTQADIDAGSAITNTATASATPAGGTYVPATADESISPEVFAPDMSFEKRAVETDFENVGDIISYEYDVQNTGNVSISAITVTDDKIAVINCPVTTLAPGASTTCLADYAVTQADLNAGFVTNNASVEGTPAGGSFTPPTDTVTVNGTQSPAFTLVKTAVDTNFSMVGDVLAYEYLVTNTGTVEITGISVSDDKISAVSCPVTDLMPAQSVTCTASYSVTQADIDAGSVTNIAQVEGTPAGGTLAPVSSTETVNATQLPEIEIVKTALTIDFASVGDTLDYEYLVTNSGNTTITNAITVTDDKILPPRIVLCPAIPAGGLLPGGSVTCTASYDVTQADLDAGFVTNIATATDGTNTSTPDQATVAATQNSGLGLTKTANETTFTAVGDSLTYEYVVTNLGNVTITSAITVSDDKIANVTCPALPASGLMPMQSLTCSADYTVTQADLDAGNVTNVARATDGTTTSPEVSETVNAAQTEAITLEKTAATTTFVNVGDTLDYSYVVTNTGNVTLTSEVSISDDRIANVNCPALPAAGLAPNASLTCTGTDTVSQADLDSGSVTNTATAMSGTVTSPAVSETVGGEQNGAIALEKVARTNDFTAVGDILSYDFIVTNTGNVTLTAAISIADDKIGAIACPALPASGLVPGAEHVCSADYSVTQADIDAGTVTNIASASSGTSTSVPDTATVSATQAPALSIEKSTAAAAFSAVGEIISYQYRVTNSGNITLNDAISVIDNKIASVNCPALPAGGFAPNASLTCAANYAVTQADLDAGFVTNIASATDGTISSAPDSVTVDADIIESLAIVKRAVTQSFSAPGDIVSYEYDVTNTGNATLMTAITVDDDKIPSVICPSVTAQGLSPQATLTCSADYTITQPDVDLGSVTNIARAVSGATSSDPVSVTVEGQRTPDMVVTKAVAELIQVGGPIYDVTYEILMENTGNVTLTSLQLQDDLAAALAPAVIYAAPTVSISGFTDGSVNQGYDGSADINILSGQPQLPVGEAGSVTINVRIDTTASGPAQGNTAIGQSSDLDFDVPSNDPTITPDTQEDVNPTPLTIIDTDGDGSADNLESLTADRDGDGVVDAEDYDPTGYFYCEESAEILTGGGISVSGPFGTNSSVGTANNIVIVQDGSNGYFQFYVTAPGTYTMTPIYPTSGVPSTTRLVQPTALDVTTLLPENPAVLGSSEVGNTGRLADASLAANPEFYFDFTFEAGDPAVFMNNIPMKNCGTPEVSLLKTVTPTPRILEDGRQEVTYTLTATNVGQTLIENLQISDDLGSVFGADRVEVKECRMTEFPAGFQDSESTTYNGVTDIDTLNGVGDLAPGETIVLEMDVVINPDTDGQFVNTATVSGVTPLNGDVVESTASAVVDLLPLSNANLLQVMKTAQPRTVQIGDSVIYNVEVTNASASTMTDLRIVDRLPDGFAYVPNTAVMSSAQQSLEIEPNVTTNGVLSWPINQTNAEPFNALQAGDTLSVSLRLLAGPNVQFGAHENQAYVESLRTGTRSEIATAIVDYIPEPSFDCTPVIGRVYDDVNHNGYPDDGEPGLPAVRLMTVNGDIITTDQYGRYHIPCAIIANSERGSNFLLKTDVRSLPLGYSPTTENPRVVRATRGKFVKMNFGAAHRPKLRIDVFTADFDAQSGLLLPEAGKRIISVLSEDKVSDRAILVYHADELETVDTAQDALSLTMNMVRDLSRDQFKDIAMEASWGDAKAFTRGDIPASGQVFERPVDADENRDRVAFFANDNGTIERSDDNDFDDEDFSGFGTQDEAGLRGSRGSRALQGDTGRPTNSFGGRRDNGSAESARPGRLMRWIGWGNKTSSYVEGMEIETTTTVLDMVKRLNAYADVVSTPQGRVIRGKSYWNYDAFIKRAELRVFDADRSTRGTPFASADFVDGEVSLFVNDGQLRSENTPETMVYVLRVYDADGNFDETAPKTLSLGSAETDSTEEAWRQESQMTFGHNTLLNDNIRVRGGSVRVYGRNVPGDQVSVMGQTITVDNDGKFVAEQILPTGKQSVEVRVAGVNGTENRILRRVDVKNRDTFYVAQIEATVGENITEDASGDRSFEEGRVAFYVRSRLNDRWAVTATADTGEAEIENLFSGLDDKDLGQLLRRLDPERFYPTHGDDSTIEQDAPTSGKFYARIERDDDYALWGNYQTNFNDTEFARVQRTLYGAKLHWDENGNQTKFGDERTRFTAFVAQGGSRQGRDELRGTGGSVYYLRNGDIAIGSEILRIETRDRVSGLVFESRRLTYGADYDMDFIQGRVILKQPLGSSVDDGRLFRDGSLSGDETVLVIDYEFTPLTGGLDNAAVYGMRGSRWFGDHIKLGGTYNHDTDGGAESDLYELDLTLQHAAGTYLKGEIAKTKGAGVETFRSLDGGFTYNPLARGGRMNNASALAYALEAAVDFTEVDGFNLDGSSYAYWRKREAGFAGYAESTNQQIQQFGGGLSLALSNQFDLTARADVTDDKTIGTNSFAEASLDYKANEHITASIGASFNDDARGNSGTSLGGRVDYKFDDDRNVYVYGQVAIQGDNQRTTDRAGIGAEMRLSKKIIGGGEVSAGEDGLGARASLHYDYGDGNQSYVSYELPLNARAQSNNGTFNLGARRRYSDSLSVYGEERMQLNDLSVNGVTHAYGVDYDPGNWKFGISAEVGRIDDIDREAFSANIGFASDRVKFGVTGEWREDENVDTNDVRNAWLLRSTASYLASEELRLQGKLNFAFSDQSSADDALGPQTFNEAEFIEASLAAAYRPIWDDRLNVLAKLVWLEDLSPTSQRFNGESINYRQKSQIASLDASYDISPRFTLGGKYAYRAGSVTSSRESLDFTRSEAELAIIRLDFHATHKWDAVVEGRRLDIGNGVIVRDGGLLGVYRHVNDNAKIGLGLTWGGIEEEYLAATSKENDIGWYLNVVGKF